MKATCVPKRYW